MQTLSPSVQEVAGGMESVEDTAQPVTGAPEPLISGPAHIVLAGVGTFLVIFVLGMLLLIRGRVTKPAKRRAEAASKTYFEPAGEDADISFDEDDAPRTKQQTQSENWRTDDIDAAEVVIERGNGGETDHIEDAAPMFDEPLAKPEKKKSAFAGLFSKKPRAEDERSPFNEETIEEEDGFFTAEEEAAPVEPEKQTAWRDDPPPAPRRDMWRREEPDPEQGRRLEEAEEAARAALKRAEEAEALARDLKRANEDAKNIMDVGLRRREAALDERANELLAMERRLADLTHEFEERAEALQPSAPASQAAASSDIGHGVSEAHFEEFADLMGERFDALRGAVNGAIEKMTRRLDALPPQSGAPTATAARVQLSDLLSDALAPGRFKLSQKLSTGRTADAVIIMPGPMAALAIDARFPVEAFDAWQLSRNAGTETELRRAILRHIADAAEKLISPEETADCAIMFVPSENILSELHAHFSDLVQESYRARVWMVSPTSLMATLHTISAVMAGAGIKEMSAVNVIDELHALRSRVAALEGQRKNGADHAEKETRATVTKAPREPAQYGDVFEGAPQRREPTSIEDKPPFPLR
ncbi:DNA recombination protein RmuC [Hyphococcus sp.]|uniref:DNA recombination protein RmuC n=1 Tax=Hyphococcus sp. TaxID=2038636 RepID=UPI003D0A399B